MVGQWRLGPVARTVREGGVIAYPTEAVWGLRVRSVECRGGAAVAGAQGAAGGEGADPGGGGHGAVRLPARRPARGLARPAAWQLAGTEHLAGAHRGRLPAWITGRHGSVALRVSDHPLVRALCAHTVRWCPPRPTRPAGRRRVAAAGRAVFRRLSGRRARRRAGRAAQSEPDPRPALGSGAAPGLSAGGGYTGDEESGAGAAMPLHPLVPSDIGRVRPARLAQPARRATAAALPARQRLLRAHLRAAAAPVGGGLRPLAVRCPGPWRQRPRRPFPRLEPQRRTGRGGLPGRPCALRRGAGAGLRAQFRRGAQRPDAAPPSRSCSSVPCCSIRCCFRRR